MGQRVSGKLAVHRGARCIEFSTLKVSWYDVCHLFARESVGTRVQWRVLAFSQSSRAAAGIERCEAALRDRRVREIHRWKWVILPPRADPGGFCLLTVPCRKLCARVPPTCWLPGDSVALWVRIACSCGRDKPIAPSG